MSSPDPARPRPAGPTRSGARRARSSAWGAAGALAGGVPPGRAERDGAPAARDGDRARRRCSTRRLRRLTTVRSDPFAQAARRRADRRRAHHDDHRERPAAPALSPRAARERGRRCATRSASCSSASPSIGLASLAVGDADVVVPDGRRRRRAADRRRGRPRRRAAAVRAARREPLRAGGHRAAGRLGRDRRRCGARLTGAGLRWPRAPLGPLCARVAPRCSRPPAAAAPDCPGGPFAARTLAHRAGHARVGDRPPERASSTSRTRARCCGSTARPPSPSCTRAAEEPGGLAVLPFGAIIMGVGNSIANGTVGDQTGPSSLIRINPNTRHEPAVRVGALDGQRRRPRPRRQLLRVERLRLEHRPDPRTARPSAAGRRSSRATGSRSTPPASGCTSRRPSARRRSSASRSPTRRT